MKDLDKLLSLVKKHKFKDIIICRSENFITVRLGKIFIDFTVNGSIISINK